MNEHTPGQLAIYRTSDGRPLLITTAEQPIAHRTIAQMMQSYGEVEKYAALFAASPDLLAACEAAQLCLDELNLPGTTALLRQLADAIRKAKQ